MPVGVERSPFSGANTWWSPLSFLAVFSDFRSREISENQDSSLSPWSPCGISL